MRRIGRHQGQHCADAKRSIAHRRPSDVEPGTNPRRRCGDRSRVYGAVSLQPVRGGMRWLGARSRYHSTRAMHANICATFNFSTLAFGISSA
jgi:hypothetical protein